MVILFCVFLWQEDEVDPTIVDVNYYICMVHHGQFLSIFKKKSSYLLSASVMSTVVGVDPLAFVDNGIKTNIHFYMFSLLWTIGSPSVCIHSNHHWLFKEASLLKSCFVH